jgi:hypothetical protein
MDYARAELKARTRLDATIELARQKNAAVGEAFRLDVEADRASAEAIATATARTALAQPANDPPDDPALPCNSLLPK